MNGGLKLALTINKKFCKGCGICVAFCPKQVLELDELGKVYAKSPEACISCGLCELRCPDYAIQVVKKEKEAAK
jgi:2-oxoglutarate ferredoxin oxidoreductase subunit delta